MAEAKILPVGTEMAPGLSPPVAFCCVTVKLCSETARFATLFTGGLQLAVLLQRAKNSISKSGMKQVDDCVPASCLAVLPRHYSEVSTFRKSAPVCAAPVRAAITSDRVMLIRHNVMRTMHWICCAAFTYDRLQPAAFNLDMGHVVLLSPPQVSWGLRSGACLRATPFLAVGSLV